MTHDDRDLTPTPVPAPQPTSLSAIEGTLRNDGELIEFDLVDPTTRDYSSETADLPLPFVFLDRKNDGDIAGLTAMRRPDDPTNLFGVLIAARDRVVNVKKPLGIAYSDYPSPSERPDLWRGVTPLEVAGYKRVVRHLIAELEKQLS